jgi:uncharacterized protein YeaO (DUF488 family)
LMIGLKRVYDPVGSADGTRLLVERLWPRGVKKTALKIDNWVKDVAPSAELRKWFNHDPAKWDEFRRRYFEELTANTESWQPILQAPATEELRSSTARTIPNTIMLSLSKSFCRII